MMSSVGSNRCLNLATTSRRTRNRVCGKSWLWLSVGVLIYSPRYSSNHRLAPGDCHTSYTGARNSDAQVALRNHKGED